jgi:hypothetical protein
MSPHPLLARRRVRRVLARFARWLRPVRRLLRRGTLEPSQIRVSWTGDPARSLTIRWNARAARSGSCVEIRPLGADAWRRITAHATPAIGCGGFVYDAAIGELAPDSPYEYRVSSPSSGERWSAVHRVRTAPAPPEGSLRAVFFSDVGVAGRPDGLADAAARVVAELVSDAPAVALGGGDYAYADTDLRFVDPADAIDAWFEQMQPLFATTAFMPVLGNHEILLGEGYDEWGPRLAVPAGEEGGRSYSFDVGPTHFCALFAPGTLPEQRHLDWLERDLAKARQAGAHWLVVYQHAPVFAHGRSHPAREEVRSTLPPIFERYGVDLHLSAHDQSYERTFALCDGASRVAAADPTRIRAGTGVVYAKISPAGKRSNRAGDFSRITHEMPPQIAVRSDECHHYGLLRIDSQRLEVEIVGIPEGDEPRRRVDHFTIERS